MRTTPIALGSLLVLGSALAGCVGGEDYSLDGTELSDDGATLEPQAFQIDVTPRVCDADPDTGEAACDPNEEDPKSARVLITGVLDLSGADPVVLPCDLRAMTTDKTYDFDRDRIQKVPSGAVRAGYDEEGNLGVSLAIPMGVSMTDPFTDAFDGARASDDDQDGHPGLTYSVSIGSIRLGARFVATAMTVAPGAEPSSADVQADWAIFEDSIPFVNVAKKVQSKLEGKAIVYQDATLALEPAEPSCDAAVAAFGL